MTFSNTHRKLGRLSAIGLATFALAAPAASGMIPDGSLSPSTVEPSSGALAHPDNRPARPTPIATSGAAAHPDNRAVRPTGVTPGASSAPLTVGQPAADAVSSDWRTISIALSGTLAALIAGLVGVAVLRRSHQRVQHP